MNSTILKEDKGFFKKVADATLDPIIIMDQSGEIIFWNKASEKFFGYKFSEVENKTLHDLILPKGKYDVNHSKNLLNFYQTGDSPILNKILELEVVNKKNELMPIELSVSVLKDEKNIYAVGMIRDINIRKKIENERRIIFDSVPAWIFYKDTKNNFVQVNQAFAGANNSSKENLEGKSLFDLYPKDQAEKFWLDDKEIIKSGLAKYNIIEPIKIKEKTMWVKTDKIPFFDKNKKVIGIIGFAVDITREKEAMEALEEKNREITKINDFMVNRENRMAELKQEIADLKKTS